MHADIIMMTARSPTMELVSSQPAAPLESVEPSSFRDILSFWVVHTAPSKLATNRMAMNKTLRNGDDITSAERRQAAFAP